MNHQQDTDTRLPALKATVLAIWGLFTLMGLITVTTILFIQSGDSTTQRKNPSLNQKKLKSELVQ